MGASKTAVYVIFFLGMLATILGFAAEGTRVKVSQFHISDTCEYPRSPANKLGFSAAFLTFVNQIIISVFARCGCCERNSSNTQSVGAVLYFVFSWITAVIGYSLLINGAILSTQHKLRNDLTRTSEICIIVPVPSGLFAGGACFAFVACSLGLFSYYSLIKYRTTRHAPQVPNQGGIAMGKPQQFVNTEHQYV